MRRIGLDVVTLPGRIIGCCLACAVALSLLSCGAQGEQTPKGAAASTLPAPGVAPVATPPNAEPNGRAWGPPNAPIKVLKFVDPQCPTCAKYATEYEPGIVAAFAATGKVRYEVRILTFIGPESYTAGLASLCAADQDAFWPMYHLIFERQPIERENTGQFSKAFVEGLAAQLGLDTQAFSRCMDSAAHKAQLEQDAVEAKQYGVARVPALVVNGTLYDSARSADDLRQIFAQIAPGISLGYTP